MTTSLLQFGGAYTGAVFVGLRTKENAGVVHTGVQVVLWLRSAQVHGALLLLLVLRQLLQGTAACPLHVGQQLAVVERLRF